MFKLALLTFYISLFSSPGYFHLPLLSLISHIRTLKEWNNLIRNPLGKHGFFVFHTKVCTYNKIKKKKEKREGKGEQKLKNY